MHQDPPAAPAQEPPTLGDTLRAARKAAGLTATELGAKARVSAASVSRFEAGSLRPATPTLERLADALGLDLATLV